MAPALPIGTVEVGVSQNGLDLVGGTVMYTVTKQNPPTLDSGPATTATRTYQGPVMAHPNMFNIAPVEPVIVPAIVPATSQDDSASASTSIHTSPRAEPYSLAVFSIAPRAAAASMATGRTGRERRAGSAAAGGGALGIITVTGANFVSSSELTCRFTATNTKLNDHVYTAHGDGDGDSGGDGDGDGQTYVAAHWASPTTLTCAVPEHPPGVVAFAVSNNGLDFVESVESFTFEPAMTISSLYPLSGSIFGGTVLRVKGANFPTDRPLSCSFDRGQTVVPATVLTKREAECHVPRARAAGRVVVQVCEGGNLGEYGGTGGAVVGADGGWSRGAGGRSTNRCSGGDEADYRPGEDEEGKGTGWRQ